MTPEDVLPTFQFQKVQLVAYQKERPDGFFDISIPKGAISRLTN